MKQLWAPWRMSYICGEDGDARRGCIFCLRDLAAEDPERLVVHRGTHAFVIMNRYPYSNGHLMVAPYRHTAELAELDVAEVLEMHHLLLRAKAALHRTMSPQGFNLGMNLGQVAGAGVADHLHLHLVPRWQGDTNFMPVLAEVRSIPQHLEESYRIICSAFKTESGVG